MILDYFYLLREEETPLDCDCYMFSICYTNSGLCKYFRDCVMPLDTELEALFNHVPTSVFSFLLIESKT